MELDPSTFIEVEIEIIGYLDEHGEIALATRVESDTANTPTVVGMIEQAKFRILEMWSNSD